MCELSGKRIPLLFFISETINTRLLKKSILILMFIISFPYYTYCQTWEWAMGAERKHSIDDVIIDKVGNSFYYSYLPLSISDVNGKTYFDSNCLYSVNKEGELTKVKKISVYHTTNKIGPIRCICLGNDTLYLLITLAGELRIDNVIYKTNDPSNRYEFILLRFDKELNFIDLEMIGFAGFNAFITLRSMLIDQTGSIYISGHAGDSFSVFNQTIEIVPFSSPPSFNEVKSFVIKCTNHEIQWIRYFQNKTKRSQYIGPIYFDHDNNIIFQLLNIKRSGSILFDTNYIIKLSKDNQVLATNFFLTGYTGSYIPLDYLKIDSSDNIYIFIGASEKVVLSPIHMFESLDKDVFCIAKYNTKLQLMYAYQANYDSIVRCIIIEPSSSNMVYMTISYTGNISINGYQFNYQGKNAFCFALCDSNLKVQRVTYVFASSKSFYTIKQLTDIDQNLVSYGIYKAIAGGSGIEKNDIRFDKYYLYGLEKDKNLFFTSKLNPDSLRFEYKQGCIMDTLLNISEKVYDSFTWNVGNQFYRSMKGEDLVIPKIEDQTPVKLTGYKLKGIKNIYRDTLYKQVDVIPHAAFETDTNEYCQWVHVYFRDLSGSDTIHPHIGESWQWDFGDGSSSDKQDPWHTYTQSGVYSVRLVYSNGFCFDTFVKENRINIIEAPKPGFSLVSDKGCIPFETQIISETAGRIIKTEYYLDDSIYFDIPEPMISINTKGNHHISQYVTGPTGCITKDSLNFYITSGYFGNEIPNLKYISVVNDKSILLNWENDQTALISEVRRSDPESGSLQKVFTFSGNTDYFLDTMVETQKMSYYYQLVFVDSCSKYSAKSNIHRSILLYGENVENMYALLRWNNYEGWDNIEKEHVLIKLADNRENEEEKLVLDPLTENYIDHEFYRDESLFRYYQIKAVSKGDEDIESKSNLICINYFPTVIIPTAFTPNGDQLNDVFEINAVGIQDFQVQIFNRWGECIYIFKKGEFWDGTYKGKICETGVYFYQFNGTTIRNANINRNGTINLIN